MPHVSISELDVDILQFSIFTSETSVPSTAKSVITFAGFYSICYLLTTCLQSTYIAMCICMDENNLSAN